MNYDLSVDELIKLVEHVQLTYNPIDDMFKIVKLGEIIYNTVKYQKWKVCDNLYESVVQILDIIIPDVEYCKTGLQELINIAREKNVYPDSTKTTIIDFIRTKYVEKSGFNYSYITPEDMVKGREYLLFITTLRDKIYSLYDGYKYKWDEINDEYDVIDELFEKIYSKIEEQEEYVEFINRMSKVMEEVDILLKRFYKITKEYVSNGGIDRDYECCFNTVIIKNNIDKHTEQLLRSSIYKSNLELNKLNINIKLMGSIYC